MATAMIMHEAGGPQVLRRETVTVGEPGPGQVRLKQTAIGVNFHDIYVRSGLYRTLPGIPGWTPAWWKRWARASPRSPPATGSPIPPATTAPTPTSV